MIFKNLTGVRFGTLIVAGLSSNNPVKWDCVCDCGKKRIVAGFRLKSGVVTNCGRARYCGRQTPVQRFYSRVDKNGPEPGALGKCWIWMASKQRKGYGIFQSGGHQSAHRFSFFLKNGPIPLGMFVLHKCDNPACVNPDHLFLGTHADNMADMVTKGRACSPDEARRDQLKIWGALGGRPKK